MRRLLKSAACSVKLTVLFVVLSLTSVYSQTSNKGTDFWVAYSAHIDGKLSRMTLFLSSDVNTSYQVEANGTIMSGNITANVVTPVFINPNLVDVYIESSGAVETKKGIHVTSANPISVYSIISQSARTGGSMILPTRTLGSEYYAFSYANQNVANNNNNRALSQFTIVAVEDDTEIEITPTVGNATNAANTKFKISQKLNKGDIYQYQAKGDVTGSLIKTLGSCKPIAVFSGSTFTAFCETGSSIANPSSGDNLYQQLFPVSAWGKKFAVAPFYNALNGNTDALRILVSEDNTTISLSGSAIVAGNPPLNNPYAKGSVITLFTKNAAVIQADKPIGVVQYQNTQNCNSANVVPSGVPKPYAGDPEMTMLNPIEQTLNDITVFSKLNSVQGVNTNINKYFLNIITRTVDIPGLKVDGQSVNGFEEIDSEYSYAVLDVTSGQDQHRITGTGGFTAVAYGYGDVESYAYLAGADVKNLYQNITVKSPGNIVVNSGCVNEPVKFVLRLPYKTASVVWDVDNGQGPFTDSNPAYSEETIDGRTVYIYEYPAAAPIYTSAGKYEVYAIAQNPDPAGCDPQEVVNIDFDIYDLPTAMFSSAVESCTNSEVSFTDESVGNGKAITKWIWDFGDGGTSSEQNPKHFYTQKGIYTVNLTVQGESGCTISISSTIRILELPVASFTFSQPNCQDQLITFSDASTSPEGKIIKWIWDPGDNSGLKEFNTSTPFSHRYNSVGTYKASLKVLTEKSCESISFEQSIVINPSPVVAFTIPEICLRDAMANFTDKTTMPDGSTPASYLWNFGDQNSTAANNVSALRNPGHVYTQAGDYQVSLTVVSQAGCSVTLIQTLTVNGSDPVAGFSVRNPSGLCSNREVIFKNESTVSFGSIGKVEWYFDYDNDKTISLTDNEPEPGEEYSFQYPVFYSPASKTFRVRMVAYSGGVCSDEFVMTITVMAAPKTAFSALPNVCENGAPFQITQASEIHGQQGQGSFSGPGITSSGLFDPSLAGVGTHEIQYLFTASNGCEDSAIQHIEVMPVPSANAGKDTVILSGGQTELKGTGAGSNVIYKWSPSIGLDRDDVPNPIANPTESITYTLTITSDQGCSTSDEVFVKVLQLPEVPTAFTPNADGVNDVWNIKYLESYSGAKIKVYGRNGTLVYESLGYSSAWDGTRQGNNLPVGTYYYIIEPGSGRSRISGSVTIIR